MARVEGTHAQGGSGRVVRYGADYEVTGNTIHFRAWFDGGTTHEGEFDFDPTRLDCRCRGRRLPAEPHREGRLGRGALISCEARERRYFQRRVQIRSSELSPPACARTVSCRASR